MVYTNIALETRKTEQDVNPFFLQRWSSRAFSQEKLTKEQIYTLFEAARWAPSAYNTQPWRFYVVYRDSPQWHLLFDTLVPFNQEWCAKASALILVVSKTTQEDKPLPTSSLDTGMAVQNILLQSAQLGIVAHPMSGFDFELAKKNLSLDDPLQVQAMIAIGVYGELDMLSEQLQSSEVPSGRLDIKDIVTEV